MKAIKLIPVLAFCLFISHTAFSQPGKEHLLAKSKEKTDCLTNQVKTPNL